MHKPRQTGLAWRGRFTCGLVALLCAVACWSAAALAAADRASLSAMVAGVLPAVVRIVTVRPSHATAKHGKAAAITDDIGAGFIINPAGYIGTNKHLVKGAIAVFVDTADGARYRASIVGMTAQADIALLLINAKRPLPFVQFGDSDKVRVGDQAIAIGSPLGLDNTVTHGIISAINRNIQESPFDDYLQTDAAINHGNSGGPLFNRPGEVIGMTSVIFSPDRGSAGLGFAIPSNSLKFVFDRLMKSGEVGAGMLPLQTQPVTWGLQQAVQLTDRQGALVTSLSNRLKGSIQVGDVITTFDGQAVLDPRDLARKAARSAVGSDVALGIQRGDQTETVPVAIEALPEATPVPHDRQVPTLGLRLTTEQNNGEPVVTVASVDPIGTAAESGIQKGDTLIEIQRTPVTQADKAWRMLRDISAESRHFAAVLVRHDKRLQWLALQLPPPQDF